LTTHRRRTADQWGIQPAMSNIRNPPALWAAVVVATGVVALAEVAAGERLLNIWLLCDCDCLYSMSTHCNMHCLAQRFVGNADRPVDTTDDRRKLGAARFPA
jgi:hypothetical protein